MSLLNDCVYDLSKLSKLITEKTKELTNDEENYDVYQLTSLSDDIFILWCQEDSCLYAQTLQKSKNCSENRFKIQVS